ncbi:MAG: Flp pilus assembly protein CpaB [Solirubrobacteraceae bacterium]
MSRRRRAILLLGLALVLGGLAASDVARREASLDQEIGPLVPVVVARSPIPAGSVLGAARLAVRRVPARFAPPGTFASATELSGLRAAVPVAPGGFLTATAVDDGSAPAAGPPIRLGERVADVTAVASPELVEPGTRVDVLVSREEGDGQPGATTLALEDVEVLAASPVEPGAGAGDSPGAGAGAPRVAASLRVTVRQAVFLAAAQSFARELRLLPRAAGDRRRGDQGLAVDATLR